MEQVAGHSNIYKNPLYTGRDFGVLPVTIDRTRTLPYTQYSFLKPNDQSSTSILQDTSTGAKLPYLYTTETSAPVFSVAFIVLSDQNITVTPAEMGALLAPSFFSYPKDSGKLVLLEWDYQNTEYSLWGDIASTGISTKELVPGTQYIVTTSPTQVGGASGSNWFNTIPPGMCYFSLNNGTPASKFDGVKLGILGASMRLNLTERVT